LKDGVIADFNAAEQMIRGMIKLVNKKNQLFNPALKMVVSIPQEAPMLKHEQCAIRPNMQMAAKFT